VRELEVIFDDSDARIADLAKRDELRDIALAYFDALDTDEQRAVVHQLAAVDRGRRVVGPCVADTGAADAAAYLQLRAESLRP
jgi:hypothetical protein